MADVFCIVQKTVKLSEPTGKTQLQQPLAYDNALAHSIRAVIVNDDGTPADLTEVSVVGSMMKADGNTVTPINGTVSGNIADVVLPGSCYLTPGRFKFTMNLTNSEASRTILWVEGYVEKNISGTIIDPGTPVGNIPQAIGAANSAATSATTAAASALEAAEEAEAYAESVAPNYADLTYPIGAYSQCCWHEGKFYINNTAITNAEAWTSEHWDETDISTELARCVHYLGDIASVEETKTYLGI